MQAQQAQEQNRIRDLAAKAKSIDEELASLSLRSPGSSSSSKPAYQKFKSFEQYNALVEKAWKREGFETFPDASSSIPSRTSASQDSALLDIRQGEKIKEFQKRLAAVQENVTASLRTPRPPKPASTGLQRLGDRRTLLDKDLERRTIRRRKFRKILTEDQQSKVDQFFSKSGIVAEMPGGEVSGKDIRLLMPGKWLNDEVINFYMVMLNKRSKEAEEIRKKEGASAGKENAVPNGVPVKKPKKIKQGEELLKIHAFTSFFFTKLKDKGYEGVRRWTKKVDIFACDAVLIPINVGNAHWVSACINLRKQQFEFYDSLGSFDRGVLTILREYLKSEHNDKKKKPIDLSAWTDFEHDEIPQQQNSFDCGVFTSQALECMSRKDAALDYAQSNMPYLRLKMVYEIGTQTFLNEDWS